MILVFPLALGAQMTAESGVRYGNEWYKADSRHLRVDVANDGFYRVSAEVLSASGLLADGGDINRLQLFHLGEQVPVDVVNGELHFYGERARSEMDRHLFEFGEDMLLNTRYGMYTDTAAYFLRLAVSPAEVLRYEAGPAVAGGEPTSTIYREVEKVYTARQSKFFRRTSGQSIYFSHYEWNEGFGSLGSNDLLSSRGTTTFSEKLDLPGAVAGQANLQVRFGLAFGDTHAQLIRVNNEELATIETEDGWSLQDTTLTFPITTATANFSITGQAEDRDKANLAFVAVTYPARAMAESGSLRFSLPGGPARTLVFEGTVGSGSRLYDLTSGNVYTGSSGSFPLPASSDAKDYVLVNQAAVPDDTEVISLVDLLPGSAVNYLLLTSRRLAGTEINELAAYRESVQGGGYSVHTVYVEDLYDAYGYGLRRHPQAIRNYLHAAIAAAPELNYLFLIGKGREYQDTRLGEDLEAAQETFFIPSFGYPASDNLLSADIGSVRPKLATGRLSAITTSEVGIYRKKLREVEKQIFDANQTIDDVAWMKQALFLGGGGSAGEQSAIRYNLGTMEDIFESSLFAGQVTSVYKTNSDPIEEAGQDIVFNRINGGVSVLTFYGHSSSQGFDFSIDNPQNYHNRNKYMFMMSLGCYSGDAFTEARSISERFIFLPDGGPITYAASKGLGYISALGTYGRSI
ncbi:MAG: C25 family cysteine peptidase, partial [Lewinella sp.]